MKVEILIAELQKFKAGTEVCIFDTRKNSLHADASNDGAGGGIEPNFAVSLIDQSVSKPFVGLLFDNDDYTGDGDPNPGSLIYSAIWIND